MPISLINAISKILESAVLTRLTQQVEKTRGEEQFFYRTARCTELHLTDVLTRTTDHLRKDKYVFLANLDIDGAFDKVPHGRLPKTVEEMGGGPVHLQIFAPTVGKTYLSVMKGFVWEMEGKNVSSYFSRTANRL